MKSETALATRETAAIAVTADQIELVKRTVASGASDAELKLYLYDCARQGVHPLDRLLHFTKRGGKYTPVTSIDLMRIRAAETNEYAGSDDATFDFEVSPTPRAERPPASATVTVWRLVQGTRCAFTATARWSEYYPGDAGGTMWRKMPHTMLAKCAEALALRKGFPRQLAGLYATEELDQADRSAPDRTVRAVAQSVERGAENAKADGSTPSRPATFIDAESGEELPPAPAGFHYLSDYTVNGDWHEATVLRFDLKGGSLKIATKRPQIGALLAKAANERLPVQLDVTMKRDRTDEAYVNAVHFAETGRPVHEDHSAPLTDRDITFAWLLPLVGPMVGLIGLGVLFA